LELEQPGTPHFIEARREYFRRQLGMPKRELVTSGLGGIRMSKFDRRGFIKLAGLGGGIVFASGLSRGLGLNALGSLPDYAKGKVENDFYFVQLSDTHWGFTGP
jgi:hypothetical protein